jgi:hypothetical protein
VLNKDQQNAKFQFDVKGEYAEKEVCLVNFKDSETTFVLGRVAIKNRTKSFVINVSKNEALSQHTIRIQVSLDDITFRTRM